MIMEFKGTKGKWERIKFERTNFYPEHNQVQFGNDGECVAEFVHDDFDALLISKAPEMLEMLKKAKMELSRIKGSMMAHPDCVQCSEFDDYTTSAQDCEDKIEKLIKESTEL